MKLVIQKTLLFFLLLLAFACNNEPRQTSISGTDTPKTDEMKIMIPAQTCYASSTGKDSVFLKTERFPNVVTGTLEYRFYEKDRSMGEIEGKLFGDTLIADYTFASEGIKSVRQVVFLLQNDLAIEGYGEMAKKDGKLIFKNIKEVKFGNSFKLHKTSCH